MNGDKSTAGGTPIANRVKRRRAKSDAAHTPLKASGLGNNENAGINTPAPAKNFTLHTVNLKKTTKQDLQQYIQELQREITELECDKKADGEFQYNQQLRLQGLEKAYEELRVKYIDELGVQSRKLDVAIDGLNSQITHEKKNEDLTRQIEELKAAMAAKQAEIDKLTQANIAKVAPPSPSKADIKKRLETTGQSSSVSSSTSQKTALETSLELIRSLNAAEKKVTELDKTNKELHGLLAKASDANEKLVSEKQAIEAANAELVKINKSATELLEQRQAALEQAQAQAKNREVAGQVAAQIAENEGLQRASAELVASEKAKSEALQAACDEKDAAIIQLQAVKEKAEEEISQLKVQLAEKEEELAKRNKAIEGLTTRVQEFVKQIADEKQAADARVLAVRTELTGKLEAEQTEVRRLKKENVELKQSNADVAAVSEQRRVTLEQSQAEVVELQRTNAAALQEKQTALTQSQEANARVTEQLSQSNTQKAELARLLETANAKPKELEIEVRASHDFAFLCLAGTACTILACAAIVRMNNVPLNITKDMLKALPSEMYKIVGEATSALLASGYKAVTGFFRG